MINNMLSFIAPHHCCGCDKIGTLLCANCKYNIISESKMVCIVCHRPTGSNWLCNTCNAPYERAWVVGERSGTLQRLVGLYKFEREPHFLVSALGEADDRDQRLAVGTAGKYADPERFLTGEHAFDHLDGLKAGNVGEPWRHDDVYRPVDPFDAGLVVVVGF